MSNHFKVSLTCIFLIICACKKPKEIRTVSWTGTNHSISDTFYIENDTMYSEKDLYVGHHILISDTGCYIIFRKYFEAPREMYALEINDEVKFIIFELASDSSVLNFQNQNFNEKNDGEIFCGLNYLISIANNKTSCDINYLPRQTSTTLQELDSIFNSLLEEPTVTHKIALDTTALDSIIYEKVKGFRPNPPLRSTIKFEPPPIYR